MCEQYIKDIVRYEVTVKNPSLPNRWYREGYKYLMSSYFKEWFGMPISVRSDADTLVSVALGFSVNSDLKFEKIKQQFKEYLRRNNLSVSQAIDIVNWYHLKMYIGWDANGQYFTERHDMAMKVIVDLFICLQQDKISTGYNEAGELLKTALHVFKKRTNVLIFPELGDLELAPYKNGKIYVSGVSDETLQKVNRIFALLNRSQV